MNPNTLQERGRQRVLDKKPAVTKSGEQIIFPAMSVRLLNGGLHLLISPRALLKKASIASGILEEYRNTRASYEGNKSRLLELSTNMRITKQIRVREDLHAYLNEIAYGSLTISKLADQAILLLKKQKEKANKEEFHKLKVLYPNKRMDCSKRPKPLDPSELSTFLKEVQKDLRTGELWTSEKYRANNDRDL